ncbi:MAG TPA: hypothetical protein VLG40_02990 [Candidatus Saccharimonas sp.]|nr:hypothetical protein [Candidatus Saccharimonas sp.]
MAELSYDDVRRAAEQALNNLQSAMNEVRMNVQNNRNDMLRLNPQDMQAKMVTMQRALDNMLQYMQRFDMYLQNAQNSTMSTQQLQQLILRVEQRLVNTEHIVAETTQYLEVIHSQIVQLTELNAQLFRPAEP